jgi:hypothetical protein
MEAREFVDLLKDEKRIVRVAAYGTRLVNGREEEQCIGRGHAVVIDERENIAILVEDCGTPYESGAARGAIVRFSSHPEAEPRIIGSPAYLSSIQVWDGGRTRARNLQ